MDSFTHFANQSFVAGWGFCNRENRIEQQFTVKSDPDKLFSLKYKGENGDHDIIVWFSTVKDHPELIHINSRNYRCENEPFGLFKIEACRKFYKELVRRGFQAF